MYKFRTLVFTALALIALGLVGLSHIAVADDNDYEDNIIPSVVTLWWVIFNNPEECAGEANMAGTLCDPDDFFRPEVETAILYGTGQVTQRNGRVTLVAPLFKTPDSIGGEFDPPASLDPFDLNTGLKNPMGAEVHLVVRSHGPKLPGKLDEQLNSFGGGCKKKDIDQPNIPNRPGECADVQFAIHAPGTTESTSLVYTFEPRRVSGAASKLFRTEESVQAILNTTIEARWSD